MDRNKEEFKVPILLLTWKREKDISLIINKLRKINAKNIYVNSDGYNLDSYKEKEKDKIIKTRNKIIEDINWECKLCLKFNNNNLGCKDSVINAINWFFENEEYGIILEEDCIPDVSFFYFCAHLLYKYNNHEKIGCITGVNFQNGKKVTNSSYYFSKFNHCWGWATWRKSWQLYDRNMKFWPEMKSQNYWPIDISMSEQERNYWQNIFDISYNNNIDSWAYPWLASLWYAEKITVTPEKNLVSNIGFDGLATHTKNRFSNSANQKTFYLGNIIDNNLIEINLEADNYTFKNHFFETYDSNLLEKIIKKIKLLWKIFLDPKKGFLYFKDKIN
tara:strand:- start:170 stop:1165 length:996 start_codon:yes stop_codon:yes gene_type:complete